MPVALRPNFSELPGKPGTLIPDEELNLDGWQRTGGCHTNCGLCCEYVILPLDKTMLTKGTEKLADYIKWLELHGIEVVVTPDRFEVRIGITCKHLQDDKSCGVYGQPERPRMCSTWPDIPIDLIDTGLETGCSYKWRRE